MSFHETHLYNKCQYKKYKMLNANCFCYKNLVDVPLEPVIISLSIEGGHLVGSIGVVNVEWFLNDFHGAVSDNDVLCWLISAISLCRFNFLYNVLQINTFIELQSCSETLSIFS